MSSTVGALKDVKNAVVHLALPKKEVFADEQDPSTASVLVETKPGRTLTSEQVQAVVHLVASSIDGMDPANVTVADSSGKVLTTPDGPVAPPRPAPSRPRPCRATCRSGSRRCSTRSSAPATPPCR